MRFHRLLILLGIAGALGFGAVAASARPALPVVKAKWQLVTRGILAAANDDRYLALVHGGQLTLIDERTSTRRAILQVPQNCGSPLLGQPWLILACTASSPFPPRYTYLIYNIDTARWDGLQISSQCLPICTMVAVGRYWVKLVSTEDDFSPYPPADYYLQNLQTGQWERDPATPNGRVFDDLNALNPAQPLCPPLRYPLSWTAEGGRSYTLGSITFLGPFALTAGTPTQGSVTRFNLRRCGSRLNRPIQTGTGTALASARAVISGPIKNRFHGQLLPTLRQFILRPPRHPSDEPMELVAVTRRNVYVEGATAPWASNLWVAKLPTEAQLKPKRKKRK